MNDPNAMGWLHRQHADTLLDEDTTRGQAWGTSVWPMRIAVIFGMFPRPRLIGGRRYWRAGDIDRYCKNRTGWKDVP